MTQLLSLPLNNAFHRKISKEFNAYPTLHMSSAHLGNRVIARVIAESLVCPEVETFSSVFLSVLAAYT